MQLCFDTIQKTTNIADYIKIHKLQQAMSQDEQFQCLKEHIIQDLLENRDQIPQEMRMYCMLQDTIAVMNGDILKVRHIVIPESLQRLALEQLHINHMTIKIIRLLAHKIYLLDRNK